MRWVSLFLLVVQSVAFAVVFRYARLLPGTPFSNLSAVVCSEAMKFIICIGLCVAQSDCMSLVTLALDARSNALMAVPGGLYALQNVLYFVGLSNVSISLYQVSKQLQILTTAVVTVAVFRRSLGVDKWAALILCVVGVALVSLRGDIGAKGSMFLGLGAIFVAIWLSAIAGVYTEWMLKKGEQTLWERNVQLSVYGLIFGVLTILADATERKALFAGEFFRGFGPPVLWLVVVQCFGGMITAAVIKYADNVIKVVIKAFALVICVVASRVFFDEGPELSVIQTQCGLVLVIFATSLYTLGMDAMRLQCCVKSSSKDPTGSSMHPDVVGASQEASSLEGILESQPLALVNSTQDADAKAPVDETAAVATWGEGHFEH